MIDPTEHLPPAPPPRTPVGWALLAGKGVGAIAAAVGIWWITRGVLARDRADERSAANVLLPLLMMAIVIGAIVWQELRWLRPRRRLLHLIAQVCAGKMPIESLKEVGGGLNEIATATSHLLHRARSCDRKVAELESEMNQRVQNRTDAMERAIGSLRQQAIRDPLTGLFNRRALDELLPRLADHCGSREEDLALLMMDVDNFKQLNDQLGHAAGDDFLKSIGQLIRSSLARQSDIAFRCGGDEFVIALPGCPQQPAREFADRLSALVGSFAKTIKSNPRPGLSIGLCSLSELPSPTPRELLREADRRLYEVKRHRRLAANKAA